MLVYLNQDVNFRDYKEGGKYGQVVEVSEEIGKKIIENGYGRETKVVKLTPKIEEKESTVKELTKEDIKAILDEKKIEYPKSAKKEDLELSLIHI